MRLTRRSLIDNQVSGLGLALAGVLLEQDAAYWEVHVEVGEPSATAFEVMFGVATKKDRKFYQSDEEKAEGTSARTTLGKQ